MWPLIREACITSYFLQRPPGGLCLFTLPIYSEVWGPFKLYPPQSESFLIQWKRHTDRKGTSGSGLDVFKIGTLCVKIIPHHVLNFFCWTETAECLTPRPLPLLISRQCWEEISSSFCRKIVGRWHRVVKIGRSILRIQLGSSRISSELSVLRPTYSLTLPYDCLWYVLYNADSLVSNNLDHFINRYYIFCRLNELDWSFF